VGGLVWNLFHDATVVGITGEVPGSLRLEIECEYLRDRIDDPGRTFFLTLDDCTRFVYRTIGDDGAVMDDLAAIAARRLWISGADQHEGFCIVHCSEHRPNGSTGHLEVAAGSAMVTVENGRVISAAELEAVAEEYWSGFSTGPKNQP
jgi:hypothetical protein